MIGWTLNLFGHQLVCHKAHSVQAVTNPVDGDDVPVPHFGVVLTMEVWRDLADKLQDSKISFVIEPKIRFEGQAGEQATLFF